MPSASEALTDRHRLAQIGVRASTIESLLGLWSAMIDPTDLDGTSTAWLDAASAVVVRSHGDSARLAAAYAARLRTLKTGTAGPAAPQLVPDVPKIKQTLLIRGPILLRSQMTRQTLAGATSSARAAQAASGGRQALAGGRRTLTELAAADPRATGWRRIVSAGACKFCIELSQITFNATAQDGPGGSTSADFAAHDNCGCSVEPIYQ